jgi:hypothetical protein
MVKNGMMRDEALALVRAKRPEVVPIRHFRTCYLSGKRKLRGTGEGLCSFQGRAGSVSDRRSGAQVDLRSLTLPARRVR